MARVFGNRAYVLTTAILAVIGVFTLDLFTPPPVAVTSLYVVPMVALVWWGKRRGMYLGAVVCAGLILLAYGLVPAKQILPYALTNRLLVIVVLFIFAVAMGRRITSHRELRRHYSRMKHTFYERDSALETLMAQQRQSEVEKAQLLELLAGADESGTQPK